MRVPFPCPGGPRTSPVVSFGYTLVEVLVAAALAALLATAVVGLFVFGWRTWQHSDARSQVQEQTLLVLAALTTQVRHSCPESVVVMPQPGPPEADVITLLSGASDQNLTVLDPQTGDIVWQKWVAIYLESATGRVRMQLQPLTPPMSQMDPSVLHMPSFSPSPAGDDVIARDITSLALSVQNGVVQATVQAQFHGAQCQQSTFISPLGTVTPTNSPSPTP